MEVQHLPRNVILVASQLRVEPRAVRSCQLQQSSQQITQDIEAGVGPLNLYFCHDRDLFSTSVHFPLQSSHSSLSQKHIVLHFELTQCAFSS